MTIKGIILKFTAKGDKELRFSERREKMDANDVEKIVKKWVKEHFGDADVRFLKVEKNPLSRNWDADLDVIIKQFLSKEIKKFVVEVSEQGEIIGYKKRIF